MTDDQWDKLLFALRHGKCLFLLGAGISVMTRNGVTRPLTEWLALELAEQLRADGFAPDESESTSLLYSASEYQEHRGLIALQQAVQKFYRENGRQPGPILQRVAELPLPLIINTTPDDLLGKAFRNYFRDYMAAHYSPPKEKKNIPVLDDPTADRPLLYNLFGTVDDPDSLVLTEDARLNFIQDIIQHNESIPNALLKQVADDKVVIFLGFDFEQWHLRILPKALLRRDEGKEKALVTNGQHALSRGAMVFHQKQYKMEFLPQSPDAFMEDLCSRWHKFTSEEATAKKAPVQAPVEVLFLYDRADAPYKAALDKHLAVLKTRNYIQTWDESQISPGEGVEATVQAKLNTANVILLLVSSDFLASEALYEEQLGLAMERYRMGQTVICPVLVRACSWENAVFAKMPTVLPRNKKSIAGWEDPDAAFKHVAQQLEIFVQTLLENLQA